MDETFPLEFTYRGHLVSVREVAEEVRYPDQEFPEPLLYSVYAFIDGERVSLSAHSHRLYLLMQQGRTEEGIREYIDTYLMDR